MRIDQKMTIYTAAELKPRLLAEIAASDTPSVDLSAVPEIDTAGLQLLLLARREAIAIGRPFNVTGASECVREIIALAALQSTLMPKGALAS
jgi:anti-sigma B factor antagonist